MGSLRSMSFPDGLFRHGDITETTANSIQTTREGQATHSGPETWWDAISALTKESPLLKMGRLLVRGSFLVDRMYAHRQRIGNAFDSISGKLYPVVGMRSRGAYIRVNFGLEHFQYDVNAE